MTTRHSGKMKKMVCVNCSSRPAKADSVICSSCETAAVNMDPRIGAYTADLGKLAKKELADPRSALGSLLRGLQA